MHTVLLVEDEMNLALMAEELLTIAGYAVIKAARVSSAIALIGITHVDAAILDVNLNGAEVFPVAIELRMRGVPFAFTTGYGREGIPHEYQDCSIMTKPYDADQLLREVAILLKRDGQ